MSLGKDYYYGKNGMSFPKMIHTFVTNGFTSIKNKATNFFFLVQVDGIKLLLFVL